MKKPTRPKKPAPVTTATRKTVQRSFYMCLDSFTLESLQAELVRHVVENFPGYTLEDLDHRFNISRYDDYMILELTANMPVTAEDIKQEEARYDMEFKRYTKALGVYNESHKRYKKHIEAETNAKLIMVRNKYKDIGLTEEQLVEIAKLN